ncbi:MAG: fatty acid desaturase [Bdellovibrionales bacterium]|nr:fatty acid desaturase [Bdellovibrionales bacterium]
MFKHKKWDGILVGIMMCQLGLMILPFVINLSALTLVLLVLINTFLIGTNYQCVAHNFIHNPFFKSPKLNQLFSLLNSLCLGVPASVYRIHHLEHHRHNNRPDKDETSTFRHGKNGLEENIFLYSTLGVLRTDLLTLYKTARKQSSLVVVELIGLVFFIALLANINWKLFVGYVLTSYLAGQIFALWENYCEHHHANYNDRKRDSVSCYNKVYNFLWFNNGYHQEHHFSPTIHWTEIETVKEKLPSDRMVVRFCHLTNSFSTFMPKQEPK